MSNQASFGFAGSRWAAEKNGSPDCIKNFTYGIGRCSLGWMIAAASERGLCAIGFGASADELPPLLKLDFRGAQLLRADQECAGLIEAVSALVEEPDGKFLLPLDIRGTAFQQNVWERIRQIPSGETRSYSDIATQLGTPGAVRAVAGACAANRLAVVIPCHRVLAKDGRISGYRWGVERKRQLLENEKKKRSRRLT